MTVLWVLDWEGYDARGGNARVFSTKELAKAAVPHVTTWKPSGDDNGGEYQHKGDGGLSDSWTIYPVTLDQP